MITGNESIIPLLKSREEWGDRTDGDSLGLGHYTTGGLTLFQHMVIEFTKAFLTTGGECTNTTLEQNAEWAIKQAKIVIDQLNQETT